MPVDVHVFSGAVAVLQIKVAIQLACLRQPFKKALHTAARLGAAAVEIDGLGEIQPADLTRTSVRHLRKMLDDLNLRVSAIGFQTRGGYNVEEGLDRRVEATKQAMRMAFDLGASVVVNHVGRIPPEPTGRPWDLLVETLADIGRHGAHVGAFLAAKTGPDSPADLARLIAALPAGSLGVDFDPGGLIVNGFSPRETLERVGAHVLHVHARDGVRDLAQGRGLEVPLGRGIADFPELLGMLEEHEYRGWFTIERNGADDPETEIRQAIKFLRRF